MNNFLMREKYVDVIIPIYNKELYIKQLIKNISKLKEEFFNIIIIDDGSTDNSYSLLKETIAESYNESIYLIRKKNGGVSSARNFGLDYSNSKYVWFCDSDDDLYSKTMNSFISELVSRKKCDLLTFGYEYVKDDIVTIKNIYSDNIEEFDAINYMLNHCYFTNDNDMSTVWNKIYLGSLARQIKFNEGLNHSEDRIFNYEFLAKARYVLRVPLVIYSYFAFNPGSLTKNTNKKKFYDIFTSDLMTVNVLKRYKNVRNECQVSRYLFTKNIYSVCPRDCLKVYFLSSRKLGISLFPKYKKFKTIYILTLSMFRGFYG